MRKSIPVILRALMLAITLSAAAFASAQDTLAPKWIVFGSMDGKASYSSDGTKILVTSSRGFSLYNGVGTAMTAHEEWALFEDAVYSFDSKDVYYSIAAGGSSKIYKYNIATKARTALPGISEARAITDIAVSKDGKKLGYSTFVGGSTYKTQLYSLETSSTLGQFNHGPTPQLLFVENDSKVLVAGPALYDLTGTLLRSSNTGSGYFRLTPNGTSIVTFGGSQIRTLNYSDFSLKWTYNHSQPIGDCRVSRDGVSVLFTSGPQSASETWVATSLAISSGLVRTLGITGSSPRGIPLIAINPVSNKVLFMSSIGAWIQENVYASGNGGSTSSQVFAFGNALADREDLPSPIRYTVASGSINSVSVGDTSGARVTKAIDQTNGTVVATKTVTQGPMFMFSPQGSYYFEQDDRLKLKVGRWDNSGIFSTLIVDPLDIYGEDKGWANDSLLWVNKGADRGILQVRYDGTTLTKGRLIKGTFGIAGMTADESRIAMRETTTGAVKVYNAVTGIPIGTIAALSSEPIDKIQFVAGNRLVLHELNATTHENTLRIYDVTSSPVLIHQFTESATGDHLNNCGTVSPAGNYFAFGHTEAAGGDDHTEGTIHVYRVSDGLVVRQWSNQYLGANLAMEFSPDEFVLNWVLGSGMLSAAVIPSMPTSLTVSPTSVTGAGTVVGTITLNRAVNQDTAIHVTSTSTKATVPTTVTVLSGQTAVSFDITTSDVVAPTNATLSATLGGATVSTVLALNPSVWVTSLDLSGNDFSGNTTADVTVHLSGAAPAGFSVPASSNAAAVVVPSSVPFTEGATTAVVTLTVKKVTSDKTVTVTIGGQTIEVRLHAPAAAVTSVTSNPMELTGAGTIDITITLDKPAPADFSVPATSSAAAITVPSTISIPEGETSVVVTLPVKKVTADKVVKITVGGKYVQVTLHNP